MPIMYKQDGITLWHGEAADVIPTLEDRSVRMVLTDPPYDAHTHANASTKRWDPVTGTQPLAGHVAEAFTDASVDELRAAWAQMAPKVDGWSVATMAWQHPAAFLAAPPPGWKFIRCGVWDKGGTGAPQFTGDRPGMGWEAVAIMHTEPHEGRMRWNGGGRAGIWRHHVQRGGEHPTQKPINLYKQLICDFTNVGDLILDPFAGSGTSLVAARELGREIIGVERELDYCKAAVRRLAQGVLPLEATV